MLPSLWEDPYELKPFEYFLEDSIKNRENNVVLAAMLYTIKQKTYAQSWTSLAESDALWRIYDKKGSCVRIGIKTDDVLLLNGISCIKVQYYDLLSKINFSEYRNDKFDQLFAMKRKAFSHEKEVRLLSRYRFPNDDDKVIEKHVKAFLLAFDDDFRKQYLERTKLTVEDFLDMFRGMLIETGITNCPKTKEISFAHIPNFISSVMLSPFAADWFENTVSMFCKQHELSFYGKSKLYFKGE